MSAKVPTTTDLAQREDILRQLLAFLETLGGDDELDSRLGPSQRNDPNKTACGTRSMGPASRTVLQAARCRFAPCRPPAGTPPPATQLRQLTHARFGLVGLLRVLDAQTQYLTTASTASATDNELALLWWDYYPRQNWLKNPLSLTYFGRSPTALMVMRLDGPDPTIVQRMMQTSVEVEKTGLDGTIAIDARGIAPIDDKGNLSPFGEFDETLRNLAFLIRTKTHLKIAFDDQDIVFPPHYVKNVACYVGWYSVSQLHSRMRFQSRRGWISHRQL